MSLRIAALLVGGGALGVLARYYAGSLLPRATFPWGTAVVNIVGSFLIGLFMFGAVQKGYGGEDARLFVVVGFLGAFTTMSAFAFDSVNLMDDGDFAKAAAYFLLNPVACIAGAYAGRALGLLVPAHGA